MKEAVAGDPGVVDQHVYGPDLALDLAHAVRAGIEVAHVPLEHRDAGLALEALRRLVVARVRGRDREALVLEPLRDRRPDPPAPPRHQCYSRHSLSSSR